MAFCENRFYCKKGARVGRREQAVVGRKACRQAGSSGGPGILNREGKTERNQPGNNTTHGLSVHYRLADATIG